MPWWAMLATFLVLVTAAFAVEPLRDPATLETIGEARLELSAAYLSIAPFSNVLDTLTLLAVGQHIALLLWVIGLFAVVRVLRARWRTTSVRREAIASIALLGGIVLVYAVMALAARPMAQLVTADQTVLVIDFHAHTQYSHDGRPGWTENDVRAWHHGAGFDVAYITDHATFEGAERGIASNPGQAGEGTMLLQGIEVMWRGEHVNVLSAGRHYRGLTTPNLKDMDEQSLALASFLPQTSPIVVLTVPGDLSKVPASNVPGAPTVRAIEIVDGSPRGLSQGRRDRALIVQLADSFNLALVTGSDNHGYGRAAPGWTLMRIPGWRGMTTDSLARRIEGILRAGGRTATRTVERRVAGGANPIALAFTLPVVTWRMFTTIDADERMMWLVWAWGLVFVMRGLRRWRVRRSATT